MNGRRAKVLRFGVVLLWIQSCACGPGAPEPDAGPLPDVPTLPGAPRDVLAQRGRGEATITWTAPDDGRSPLLHYTVTSTPGGVVVTATSTRAIVTGLLNGTSSTFTVNATNAVGTGPDSLPSNAVTPATVPSAPPSVIAMAGNEKATVSWTRPVETGGSAITGYLVRFATGEVAGMTAGATQVVINGLVNGTDYAFTVSAANDEGSSEESGFSNTVMPIGIPDAPLAVTATAGDSRAVISWSPPVDAGGSEITLYTVTSAPGGLSATTTGATQATVQGLVNGTTYSFTVTASNAAGRGAASQPSNDITPATLPGRPVDVIATGANQAATVSWGVPFDDGGGAITEYTVTASPGGITTTTTRTTVLMTGLSNGASYTFTVRATNWAGTGLPSLASNVVIPLGVPAAPTAVIASRGNASATVSWTAPVDTGGTPITSYLVTPSSGPAVTVATGATQATITGLTNGTSYTFTVNAVNVIGASGASDPSNAVIPSTVPGASPSVTAVAGDQEATVNWIAAAANGAPITRYDVRSIPGNMVVTTTGATSARITGLTNGTAYSFSVTASNLVGAGPASTPSSAVVPSGLPGVATNVVAIPGNSQATISWVSAPNNGSAITAYVVSSNPPTTTFTSAGTTLTFTGLTNGTPYTFTVTAQNGVGVGPPSSPSNVVIPATSPGAPTGVTAVGATGQATVSWVAPVSDGSSAITGYLIESLPIGLSVTVGNVTQATLAGLTWSASYSFTVKAINAIGRSVASVPSNVISLFSPMCAGTLVMGGQVAQLPTNLNTTSVRLRDLDGDGFLDLLLADLQTDLLTLRRGKGNGSFYPPQFFPLATGNGPGDRFILVADLNEDGRLDVAVTMVTSFSLSVFLGNATTTLSARLDSPLTAGISLSAGDFDGDGHVDLFAGVSNGSIAFLRGAGTGVFTQGTGPGVAGRWVTNGDFDRDGRLDLAVSTGSSVAILLGTGNGTFGTPAITPLNNAGFVSSVDLNADGKLDLAVLGSNLLNVFLGQGNGTFGSPSNWLIGAGAGPAAGSLVTGDLNGDGKVDVVTSNSSTVSILMGAASGILAGASTFATGSGTRSAALGDVTGDGRLDLVVANASVLKVLAGRGDGTFPSTTAGATFGTGSSPLHVAAGDFNRDGKLDLASANFNSRTVSISLGLGGGSFSVASSISVAGQMMTVHSIDLDADGMLDLVTTNRGSNNISLLRGTGTGTFQSAVNYATGTGPSHAVVADFDGDGQLDVATANYNGDSLSILKGNGAGGLLTAVTFAVAGGPHSLAVGDFDSDGRKDLAIVLFNSNRAGVLRGNGDGTFQPPVTYAVGTNPRSIVAGDFDSDGHLDVAVANYASNLMMVLRGAGNGTLLPPTGYPLPSGQGSIFASDVDGDGKLDLLTTNFEGSLSLFRGNGDATFLDVGSWPIGASPYGGIVGDFNGDGSADFAVANSANDNVQVLLRTGCLE